MFRCGAVDTAPQRNIHLGMDLWCNAGTEVLCPIDGVIHSFQDNTHFGDYGPTLILEHCIHEYVFYTLYGHLSRESLQGKQKGKSVATGETIATLGTASVNGDYAPHLHFQIIKDLQGMKGDYPGVCSLEDLDFYTHNCPNPNMLLHIF